MARLDPFRATVYSPEKVIADDVIAPPYDVVSPAERSSLAARSPYNAVHVELPADDPGRAEDRYHLAAERFTSWHEEGIVEVGSHPALALYRMSYREASGEARSTVGVLGALGLDPGRTGQVLPHEETTPKDKRDRLSLLRAARTNFSPVWVLTVAQGFGQLCEEAIALRTEEPWSAVDDDGVLHERWLVGGEDGVRRLTAAVATAPVILADGHHRYETACTYSDERAGREGAEALLALTVPLSDEHLSVQAIHRLLRGIQPARLPAMLSKWFEVSDGPGMEELPAAMQKESAMALVTPEGRWLLYPSDELTQAAGDDLDSARIAVALEDLGVVDVGYQHGLAQVSEAVACGMADAAVLLRPVGVDQIARVANGGRRMPPKTTFFSPKPRTGMVFRELDPG